MGVAVHVVAGRWDGASILGIVGYPVVAGIPFVVAVLGLSVVAGKTAFVGKAVIGNLSVVVVSRRHAFVGIHLVAGHIAYPVHFSGTPGGLLLGHLHHCPLKLTYSVS